MNKGSKRKKEPGISIEQGASTGRQGSQIKKGVSTEGYPANKLSEVLNV